jgi:hypothetical protein
VSAQASQTRIVNKALVLLGTSATIASLDDGSLLARAASAVWDEARDEVQADHPWNECLRRGPLAASADYTPAVEYLYAYELPQDCLRWLPWERDHEAWFEGEQEIGPNDRRYLLTSAEAPLYARWIKRVEDVGAWSPGLKSAVAAKLAKYLAKPVTGQSGMIDRMDAAYADELARAKRQDGLATGRRDRRADYRSSWLAARNQPYGYGPR